MLKYIFETNKLELNFPLNGIALDINEEYFFNLLISSFDNINISILKISSFIIIKM